MQFIYRSLRVSPRNLRAVRVRPVSFGRVGNPLVAFFLVLLPHVVSAARFAPCGKASAPRRVLVVLGRWLVVSAFRAFHRRPLTFRSTFVRFAHRTGASARRVTFSVIAYVPR